MGHRPMQIHSPEEMRAVLDCQILVHYCHADRFGPCCDELIAVVRVKSLKASSNGFHTKVHHCLNLNSRSSICRPCKPIANASQVDPKTVATLGGLRGRRSYFQGWGIRRIEWSNSELTLGF